MSWPTSQSPKDLVELTPVFRAGENEQRKAAKVYDSELCMLALPPDEQQVLSRLSQYLFCRGIIPVVVRNPTEALVHSKHSRFAVIILPDNDPILIRKIRSVDGMNSGTPVIVISTADILPESTLHMLGTNEIQEAIHRTTNSEKLEADLISALNHVIGQFCQIGDPGIPMLPLTAQNTWSTMPHYTPAPMPSTSFHHLAGSGMISPCSAGTSIPTAIPRRPSPTQLQGINMMGAANGPQFHRQISTCSLQQLQDGGAVEQGETKLFLSEPVTEIVNQGSAAAVKASPTSYVNARENSESVLPGIATLLNAIQVVEGEAGPAANNQAGATFTKFTALNSPDSEEKRATSRARSRRSRRSSAAAERQKSASAAISDTELDNKSPMPVSLAGKKPYFLALDSYREAMADDPSANPVDRHNSKERHRRIRITKAAEFFKAVIPGMDPNMDKATAFHWAVYYMVFLREALLKQDPPVIPKLHQTFKEEWGHVFNMEDRTEAGRK